MIGLSAGHQSGHPLTGRCQEAIIILRKPKCPRPHSKHKLQPPAFLQTLTAPVFSLSWLRSESRQSPIRFKHVAMHCDCPGGVRRPRETLVPSHVQGAIHIDSGCRVGDASPQLAHGLGDSVICTHSGGAKTASNHSRGCKSRPLSWLAAFGQTITRNSASHRMASARAGCDSRPAPVCARSP